MLSLNQIMHKYDPDGNKKSTYTIFLKWFGVLAIVIFFVAGSIFGYRVFIDYNKINQAIYNLQQAANKILSTYKNGFNDMTAESIAEMGLNFDNPFGDDIKVLKYDASSFGLKITDVPKKGCIKIAKTPWGNNFVVSSPEKTAEFTLYPSNCRRKNTLIIDYAKDFINDLNEDPCKKCDGKTGCMMRNGCI